MTTLHAVALAGLLAGSAWAAPSGPARQTPPGPEPIVVASKPFAESYLLAEMFAQLLESRGFRVTRRPGLGATDIAFRALRSGGIDVYPEYTGTGLVAILGDAPRSDPREVYRIVSETFARRFDVHWLPPLGFQNTYAIAVRAETARRYHLRTLSDLAAVSDSLVAGFTPDFIGRADGLPGLRRVYGFKPRAVRSLLQAVKYRALASGDVDVVDGYSTDGAIARYHLTVLPDDRGFFPAYEAAALAGSRLWHESPRAVQVLSELSGRLDAGMMRELNRRVEVDGEGVAVVAASALTRLGLVGSESATAGEAAQSGARATSFPAYLWQRRATLLRLTLRHLLLVGVSLLAAVLIAVPGGLALERVRSGAEGVIRGVGVLQTIPSIALLAFMIPLIGIGVVPALVALAIRR